MRAIVINSTTRLVIEVNILGDRQSIANAVGGKPKLVWKLANGDVVFVSEEANKNHGKHYFILQDVGSPYEGNGVVVGTDEHGDLVDAATPLPRAKATTTFVTNL